jgi:hypothetical protein
MRAEIAAASRDPGSLPAGAAGAAAPGGAPPAGWSIGGIST